MHELVSRALCICLLVGLGACASSPFSDDGAKEGRVSGSAEAPSPVETSSGNGAGSSLNRITPPTLPAATAFIGFGGLELSRLLGDPYLIRRDPGVEVWQYRNPRCLVDFYLYARQSGFQVVYLEARDYRAAPISKDQCLQLLNARHPV